MLKKIRALLYGSKVKYFRASYIARVSYIYSNIYDRVSFTPRIEHTEIVSWTGVSYAALINRALIVIVKQNHSGKKVIKSIKCEHYKA